MEFIPFLALTCNSDSDIVGKYKLEENPIDTVKLCLFSIESLKIVTFASCNIPNIDMEDLCPLEIELVRSSNINSKVNGLKFEKKGKKYIPFVDQQTSFNVIMSLKNQFGRFVFKSMTCHYKVKNEDQRVRVNTEEDSDIR